VIEDAKIFASLHILYIVLAFGMRNKDWLIYYL